MEFYEVGESLQAPIRDQILEDPTFTVIIVLIPHVAQHDDNIHCMELDLISWRRDVRMLTDRVQELD